MFCVGDFMLFLQKVYNLIYSFIKKLTNDEIGAFAAQAAFFLIISLFPFVMLLITLLQYIPITESIMTDIAVKLFPMSVSDFIVRVINELSEKASTTIISITALGALWSASKGVFSTIQGLNRACGAKEVRGYVLLRLSSLVYTMLFAVAIILTLFFLVFGNSIYNYFAAEISIIEKLPVINATSFLFGFCLLALFFWGVYLFAPARKAKPTEEIAGAVFSALGWIVFSTFFSFYIDNISNFSYFYGSLTTVVVLMLWLYVCMYIVFIGAEINVFIKENKTKK